MWVASDGRGILDYPHYTRPQSFRGWDVPEVLMSGNHEDDSPLASGEGARKNAAQPAGFAGLKQLFLISPRKNGAISI